MNDAINYKISNFEYNDDIIEYINDNTRRDKKEIPIIIPSPKSIDCDNIGDKYYDDINYSVEVKYLSYNGMQKGIAQAFDIDKSTCKWCNCIDLCRESLYSVDLKNI